MPKPKFGENIDPEVGKATQFPHNDPTKGGRPRKSWRSFAERCKEKGIVKVTKKQFYEAIQYLMNLTEEDLKKELTDKDNPTWLRWLIKDLNSNRTRSKLMQDYRDWLFGKAEQTVKIEEEGEKDLSKLTNEELKLWKKMQEKVSG